MMFNNEWDLSKTVDISSSNLAESILKFRKIKNLENFLYPKLENLNDPFLLNDMDKAVTRIVDAVTNNELILIYGDYDTDGITATAIMYRFLLSINADVTYYIPKREEGYGLSINVLENILNKDIGLIITVDCGIPSVKELEFINEIGIDCIISDHHTPLDTLPDAYCIISPKLSSNYPFSELCGAGIALKIVQAICINLNLGFEYARYVDLAALGTIADIVPLKDENRVIAKIGMDLIVSTENTGLKELIKQSYPFGIDKVNSSHLMFNIIPKLNASGRMESAQHAIKLLISDDNDECINLSKKIIELNDDRKNKQKIIIDSVINKIENDDNIKNDLIIVLKDENWDIGILGIVASHVVERYNRPCILMGYDNRLDGDVEEIKKTLKGSGRSVTNFNLISAIDYCKEFQITYGGHKAAAGNMIYEHNFNTFKKKINEYASQIGYSVSNRKAICPDYKIDLNDITLDNAQILSCFEPHGCENEAIAFLLEDIELEAYRRIGKNKDHLFISFKKNEKHINCISFRSSDYERLLIAGNKYDIIISISYNTVKDSNSSSLSSRKYVNCEILDMRLKDIPLCTIDNLIKYTKKTVYIDRNDIANTYKFIKNKDIPCKLSIKDIEQLPVFLICLDILQELGIIKYNNVDFKFLYVTELNDSIKRDLKESLTFIEVNKKL
ncbi:MAG: Single-stranded-DNA-specific exonuclease RecJ [Firmicutes bacterium ADurb.Bin146]|mgnify:CR=1 FL=1|nr:MAG: Single-stranded-DNA-specific exonuclease RecJ [Firmicutes bacterium ADurb.Bin146]